MRISDWSSDVCSSDLAIIDHRQGQWDHSLIRFGTERLHSPARQGEIAVIADPLRRNGRTEPVVATDVIATQESAVRGSADRSADAPIRVELQLARSAEHTSELQTLIRYSYAVFFL